jgi:hypothetical protein
MSIFDPFLTIWTLQITRKSTVKKYENMHPLEKYPTG